MSTRKIAEAPIPPCHNPNHYPPMMIVRESGTYEHICPQCGNSIIFIISNNTSY